MMKMLLLFLLVIAHSMLSPVKRALSEEMKTSLRHINEARKTFAKENNIGNMHEIEWDAELDNKAREMSNCAIKAGDYVFVAHSDTARSLEEALNPLQTKVACIELPLVCPNLGTDTKGFCLLGPRSSFSDSDVRNGPLGSHCPHGVADSGLCKTAKRGSVKDGGEGGASDAVPKKKEEPVTPQPIQQKVPEPVLAQQKVAEPVMDSAMEKSSFLVLTLIALMQVF